MLGTHEDPALVGGLILVALSIYTVFLCRRDKPQERDIESFYFVGMEKRHSLASVLGSLFSLTYFFGATFLYSSLFRGGMLIVMVVTLGSLAMLLPKILMVSQERFTLSNGKNILLDLLRDRFDERNSNRLLELYIVIYFGLLVEELAVTRLVLGAVFSTHPAVSTAMLLCICLVVAVYLKYGGFRAVLISDYQQLKIIVPFVIALIFLVYRDTETTKLSTLLNLPPGMNWLGALSACIFGVAWFGSSVDFFARLRLSPKNDEPRFVRASFIYTALAGLAILLLMGILFGGHLSSLMGSSSVSPSLYTNSTVTYFTTQGTVATAAIFYAAIFCMIFTTLDALLLILQQLGRYTKSSLLQRDNTTTLLLAGIAASALIPNDSVSVVGIFIGALFVLPFLAVLQAVFLPNTKYQPAGTLYLHLALLISLLIFGLFFTQLRLDFERHFMLAALTAGVGGLCFGIATITRLFRDRRE